jgi:hypothetical protein
MVEPLEIIAISGAAGGLAGKLVEKAWDSGERWLADYFKDHKPKAQERAKQNGLKFLNQVARKVRALEQDYKDDEKIKQRIASALSDPDFSAILQDALIASARTESEEKHILLARVVSERLRSEPESIVSLTSSVACDAIKCLTPKQIRFLGIITFTQNIRPINFPQSGMPDEEVEKFYGEWIKKNFAVHMPQEPLTETDFNHLESLSCIKYEPIYTRNLITILSRLGEKEIKWSSSEFSESEAGKQLLELWGKGMQHVSLTTVGQLIGIYVHDELTKTTTVINW